MIKPAEYWREQKDLAEWFGRVGEVIASTTIYNSTSELNYLTPYDYVIVDFGGGRRELMGAAGEKLKIGDMVRCVLRKTSLTDTTGLINYGLKVQKIEENL